MRLLQPFIPFITEELWQRLPRAEGSPLSLALARFPDAATAARDPEAERDMGVVGPVDGDGRAPGGANVGPSGGRRSPRIPSRARCSAP